MAEAPSTTFVMYSTHDAVSGGLAHVERQVRSIESAVGENPGLAFDLAKTLVESVCKTVLKERSIAHSEADDLPALFRAATACLPFLPPTASAQSEAREALRRTLSGLSTAIQGICELRNRCGFASHGSSTARPAMERVQALLAAEAADTIVGFLYRVHRQDRTPSPSRRTLYDDNAAFNESIDEELGMISLYDVKLQPSQVLFEMEPETYRIYLAEFDDGQPGAVSGMAPSALSEVSQ